jgi:drug/metabolite transporter (DMT)-like permease
MVLMAFIRMNSISLHVFSPSFSMTAIHQPAAPAPKALPVKRGVFSPRVLAALVAIYLLWGTSYLAIKQAGAEFPPLLLVGLRNLAAGIVLLGLVQIQGRSWGPPRLWLNAAIVGFLMISVGAVLLAMGISLVASGSAAVLFAGVPIVVCGVMALTGQRVAMAQWFGTGIGVSGLMLLNQDAHGMMEQRGMWLILGAVVATAASAVMMSRLPMPQDLIVSTGIQMLAGGGLAVLAGLLVGERLVPLSSQGFMAWLYLSLFVSVIGYLSYTYLMVETGPVVASSYAYVNPPIALLAGAWLLGERVSNMALIATGIVLVGAMTVLFASPLKTKPVPMAGID